METLGSRIKRALEASETTVADAAAACGTSAQAVYAWMRDEVKDLRNDNLFALADLTGFEARWIGTGGGPEQITNDQRLERVLKAWGELDERGKTTVLRAAEFESHYVAERLDETG